MRGGRDRLPRRSIFLPPSQWPAGPIFFFFMDVRGFTIPDGTKFNGYFKFHFSQAASIGVFQNPVVLFSVFMGLLLAVAISTRAVLNRLHPRPSGKEVDDKSDRSTPSPTTPDLGPPRFHPGAGDRGRTDAGPWGLRAPIRGGSRHGGRPLVSRDCAVSTGRLRAGKRHPKTTWTHHGADGIGLPGLRSGVQRVPNPVGGRPPHSSEILLTIPTASILTIMIGGRREPYTGTGGAGGKTPGGGRGRAPLGPGATCRRPGKEAGKHLPSPPRGGWRRQGTEGPRTPDPGGSGRRNAQDGDLNHAGKPDQGGSNRPLAGRLIFH